MRSRFRAIIFTLSLLFLIPGSVLAQNVDPTTSGPEYDKQMIEDYREAILTCDTPSLECLVHYTSRYVAIEWLVNTVGGAGTFTGDPRTAPSGGTLTPDANPYGSTPIAQGGGVIGGLNHLMGQMYAYPAAGTGPFVADVLDSAGFAQPAYAQGLGFASLNPVLDLWKVFRNVAYTFFVVIFIVIGFMIMFRTKISGQAAVTAQQAIPSVIISLIFVTFSYAIAGFLIDLMYLSMFLIIGIFGATIPGDAANQIIDYNILQLGGQLFQATGFSAGSWDRNLNVVETFLDGLTNNALINNGLTEVIGGLLLSLVVAIASLIATIKLFFELLKSYATIIMNVVMAPIFLMIGAIPGRNAFGPWLKNLIGNLSAFPTVLLIVVIFYQFVGQAGETRFTEGGFMPPFLLGQGQAQVITTLMGFALLLALPEIVKNVKERLGAKGGFGEMVIGAAGRTTLQSLPVSAMATGAAVGATVGTIGGLAGGIWDSRGDSDWRTRLLRIGASTGRGIGNAMGMGSRTGRGVSGAVGGSTPGWMKPVEQGVERSTIAFTDDERLRRIRERQNLFGPRGGVGRQSYASRRELAERQAEKARWEEERIRSGLWWTPTSKDEAGK